MDTATLPRNDPQAQFRARAIRAVTEPFSFAPHPAGGYWCLSHTSGKAYRVTEAGCTCKDFEHRGGTCKHSIALRNAEPGTLPRGIARDADEVALAAKIAATSEEQRVAEVKRFEEIFG